VQYDANDLSLKVEDFRVSACGMDILYKIQFLERVDCVVLPAFADSLSNTFL